MGIPTGEYMSYFEPGAAVLFAAVQLGPGAALWSAAGYLVVNVLVCSIIEPRFMGRGLGLSALVVFLSLVFWGWVLGPVGLFLSGATLGPLEVCDSSTNRDALRYGASRCGSANAEACGFASGRTAQMTAS